MRLRGLILGAVLCVCALAITAGAQNTANYMDQGGATWTIGSGGTLNVASGGALKIAGTDVTATLAAATSGVAAGYKVARGETALDGSNPTAAATGLTSIVACTVSIKSTSAPGVGTSAVTYGTSSGTLNLYGWKVTGTGDATLIASTGTETIGWICVGT